MKAALHATVAARDSTEGEWQQVIERGAERGLIWQQRERAPLVAKARDERREAANQVAP